MVAKKKKEPPKRSSNQTTKQQPPKKTVKNELDGVDQTDPRFLNKIWHKENKKEKFMTDFVTVPDEPLKTHPREEARDDQVSTSRKHPDRNNDLQAFLRACPHLDADHAFRFLKKFGRLVDAIRAGRNLRIPNLVPAWTHSSMNSPFNLVKNPQNWSMCRSHLADELTNVIPPSRYYSTTLSLKSLNKFEHASIINDLPDSQNINIRRELSMDNNESLPQQRPVEVPIPTERVVGPRTRSRKHEDAEFLELPQTNQGKKIKLEIKTEPEEEETDNWPTTRSRTRLCIKKEEIVVKEEDPWSFSDDTPLEAPQTTRPSSSSSSNSTHHYPLRRLMFQVIPENGNSNDNYGHPSRRFNNSNLITAPLISWAQDPAVDGGESSGHVPHLMEEIAREERRMERNRNACTDDENDSEEDVHVVPVKISKKSKKCHRRSRQ